MYLKCKLSISLTKGMPLGDCTEMRRENNEGLCINKTFTMIMVRATLFSIKRQPGPEK